MCSGVSFTLLPTTMEGFLALYAIQDKPLIFYGPHVSSGGSHASARKTTSPDAQQSGMLFCSIYVYMCVHLEMKHSMVDAMNEVPSLTFQNIASCSAKS